MKKRLVVIGGGMAGHQIAYGMRNFMDVTLIDPKTYFEVPMAVPRLLVEPGALPARMGYREFLPQVRILTGRAIGLDDRCVHVSLSGGGDERIFFDYGVIATGSRYADPLIKAEAVTEELRADEIKVAHDRLRAAKRLVIVGGGPVGVEVAAEVRESLPSTEVSLVHRGRRLLEMAPDRFSEWAETTLRNRGVKVILNERVTVPSVGCQASDGQIRTESGLIIPGNTVIWTTGAKPVTDFVSSSWPEAVQGDGLLKVDEALRLDSHPTIFVAGDVTNLPEGRLALITGFHAASITANLKLRAESGSGNLPRFRPYAPKRPCEGMGRMMIVTLGRRDGLTSLPFGQFRIPFLARTIKSKDMFVGRYRRLVGLS